MSQTGSPGQGHLFGYIFETELTSYASMRPIHLIVIDMGRVYLSMDYRIVHRFCEPKQTAALFTDAVHCYPSSSQRENCSSPSGSRATRTAAPSLD